ncbi:MAG TPA: tetratricopeptide repeat protein [Terriglobia bacterium]|nr:tetratricopeptide repeat protein [Terriglobia bacterium]
MPDNFWRKEVIQPALSRDVEAAVAEQQSILANDPNNAHACFALATLSHFKGEIEQAVQYFEKAIDIDPTYAAPHVSLGRLYALRGEYQQAWKHARAAEALGARDLVEMLERYPNLR